jgi:prevent-host-death family protein
MKWKIAGAKINFSELIRRSEKEPQLIYNRNRMVAAIVSTEEYEEYKSMKELKSQQTLGAMFNEFSSICAEESYSFETPPRVNRKSIFP